MKTLTFIAVTAMVSLASLGIAQQTPIADPTAAHYSQAELRVMMRTAGTPQQYQALASYFRQRQEMFQRRADDAKQEWDRRSQNVTGPAAKPPRPVDSARNLYNYYSDEANRMGSLAARYEGQPASPTQTLAKK